MCIIGWSTTVLRWRCYIFNHKRSLSRLRKRLINGFGDLSGFFWHHCQPLIITRCLLLYNSMVGNASEMDPLLVSTHACRHSSTWTIFRLRCSFFLSLSSNDIVHIARYWPWLLRLGSYFCSYFRWTGMNLRIIRLLRRPVWKFFTLNSWSRLLVWESAQVNSYVSTRKLLSPNIDDVWIRSYGIQTSWSSRFYKSI